MSIKALAQAVLQGNRLRNQRETKSFLVENKGQSRHRSRKLEIGTEDQSGMQRLVGEMLDEVDRLGRPWPTRFLASIPLDERNRLRGLEKEIDKAVLNCNENKLNELLMEWRDLLLGCLH